MNTTQSMSGDRGEQDPAAAEFANSMKGSCLYSTVLATVGTGFPASTACSASPSLENKTPLRRYDLLFSCYDPLFHPFLPKAGISSDTIFMSMLNARLVECSIKPARFIVVGFEIQELWQQLAHYLNLSLGAYSLSALIPVVVVVHGENPSVFQFASGNVKLQTSKACSRNPAAILISTLLGIRPSILTSLKA